MNLLLDTHIALWAISDSPRLSKRARELILSPGTSVWISAVSVWEIAIKHGLGRGNMPVSGEAAVGHFRDAGYRFLPIDQAHAAAVESLPAHHQDPFDRLLIAQARTEPMRLLTNDATVASYGDTVILV